MATGTGTRDDVIIPISEEPVWLFQIIKGEDPPGRSKPCIQEVAKTLSKIESNKTCFHPCVVSFGPYHHGKHHLKPMEHYKEVASRWFISLTAGNNRVGAITNEEAKNVYDKFIAKVPSVSSLRECYTDGATDEYNDADFLRMMFLDGCFILYFIHLVVEGSDDLLQKGHYLNQPLIIRDMFLFENQIPYSVLTALMSLKPEHCGHGSVVYFIYMIFLPPRGFSFISHMITYFGLLVLGQVTLTMKEEPCDHLLDLLRSQVINEAAGSSSSRSGHWHYYFRPISELKAVGIQVSASNSQSWSDVKFRKGFINSHLELPQIIVDDSTKTRLLNLAAYEMCPDGSLYRAVTSYICFLDSLIYNVDDVKELRYNNILLNRLGSDEEVANLFKELATNLSPESNAYSDVILGMEEHSKRHFNHVRLWISQFFHNNFTSPWTAISLVAGIFVILLTLVQTIYSVLSYYKRRYCVEYGLLG
ncbi:UPF0481-like protein [Cinnamomum micranthum f. kanehirae]|uniref:UPF0481-like protein n=1 Tax=Cinnamomum micranthum f. kanehirae TaxID=337451 RepID=A0A3S3MFH3_9MAGN|nr:UPF0481-like protein [Cinnamomum micranthum f. kanehirae]